MTTTLELPAALRNAERLPSPPAVALEVLRLSRQPEVRLDDLTGAIRLDPALAVKVIKQANTPIYRRGSDTTSVQQAALVLGTRKVTLLALSFSLAKAMNQSPRMGTFNYSHFWQRSIVTAVTARGLSRLTKLGEAEYAFLCGLIARFGQLVMATAMEEEYSQLSESNRLALPSAEQERDILGFDFHQVGAEVLSTWGLPLEIADVVSGWGNPPTTHDSKSQNGLAAIQVQLADQISMLVCDDDKGHALTRTHYLASQQFGLTGEEIDDFVVTLRSEVHDAASTLDIAMKNSDTYQQILDEARQQVVRISLEAIQALEVAESKAHQLAAANEALSHVAKTDRLTQVSNRRHFDERWEDVITTRLRGAVSNSLGLLILDVDHFKSFNDQHGHQIGDEVLRSVAAWLKSQIRDTDFLARYGGEEFVAILPNTTVQDLHSVAERLRRKVEKGVVTCQDKELRVTISIGGACIDRIEQTQDGALLLELADQCLYEAKRQGRNCSVCRDVAGRLADPNPASAELDSAASQSGTDRRRRQ